jgi:hypothetical protein
MFSLPLLCVLNDTSENHVSANLKINHFNLSKILKYNLYYFLIKNIKKLALAKLIFQLKGCYDDQG